MEAITPISTPDISAEALVVMFEDAGITVEVVPHCTDLSCPVCFPETAAEAA